MKFVKTDFSSPINNGCSYIVYITKTAEEAMVIHGMAMTQMDMHAFPWHYHVSSAEVLEDCRVPKFFHDRGYWMTCIEHNNGDWNSASTYTLYIFE